MSAPRIILASLPSFCQKLSKLVEIWWSTRKKTILHSFFRHGVVILTFLLILLHIAHARCLRIISLFQHWGQHLFRVVTSWNINQSISQSLHLSSSPIIQCYQKRPCSWVLASNGSYERLFTSMRSTAPDGCSGFRESGTRIRPLNLFWLVSLQVDFETASYSKISLSIIWKRLR